MRLGLQQGLESGLAGGELAKLLLVILLLLLGRQLGFHDSLASLKAVVHSLHIEKLALHPDICVSIWILSLLLGFLHSLLQICVVFMCEDSLSAILISIVSETNFLVFHESHHNFPLTSILFLSSSRHIFELPFLLLHYADCLLKIMLKSLD